MVEYQNTIELLKDDFVRLSQFIHAEYGIKMPPVKKTLLESRLQKRLRSLELKTYKEYCDYLFSAEGSRKEIPHFIDKITTNKTDFFREPDHFDFLTQTALPALTSSLQNNRKNISIWSAGCSTGEEPYTIAMVVNDFLKNNPKLNITFSILATDISVEVLKTAKKAVYHEMRIAPVPIQIRKEYLLRSKSRDNKTIKIGPELRRKVVFGRLNFMDSHFGIKQPMDIVFCRNVLIYFDKPTQEKILQKICRHIPKDGYFFQGHSESTQNMDLPLKNISPTIYNKI